MHFFHICPIFFKEQNIWKTVGSSVKEETSPKVILTCAFTFCQYSFALLFTFFFIKVTFVYNIICFMGITLYFYFSIWYSILTVKKFSLHPSPYNWFLLPISPSPCPSLCGNHYLFSVSTCCFWYGLVWFIHLFLLFLVFYIPELNEMMWCLLSPSDLFPSTQYRLEQHCAMEFSAVMKKIFCVYAV